MAVDAADSRSLSSSQVRIHLNTRSTDIELPNDTGPILVSTEFHRIQLSTLVNKLLETETPIPLEFLINGQFLRTSLDDFLTRNGISSETTLSVEYVKALVPPSHSTTYPHDDWVSSVDVLSASSKASRWSGATENNVAQRILSGSYDGILRVWNMSSEVVAQGSGHLSSIKSARFISPTQIVSAGIDRSLRLWKYQEDNLDAALVPSLELYGHTASVDRIAVHGAANRVLSASADHRIGLWSTKKSEAPDVSETLVPVSNKRRKLSQAKSVTQRGPLSFLRGHQSQVADVCFDERDATVGYSASWDHSVKTWDLTTSTCVDTRTTAQSLFSIAHLPDLQLLAVGTSARHITLIDPRVSATTVAAMTLRGHFNAVVSLAKDPATSHQLASGSHDGTCRIWDLRSVRTDGATEKLGESVYIIDRESREDKARPVGGEGVKVFDICWDQDVGLISAGEDKRVQINRRES